LNVHQIVEAVLFASDAPLTADEIARADESLDEDQVEEALQYLRAEYDDAGRSFQITDLAEGYQILTRPEFAPYLERFDTVPRPSRLSGPALETLSIVAYRQPIGRLEVEYIRGVGASGVMRSLVDRRLIDVVGRAEGLGRPLLYGTTTFFLEHFGFKSLEDLPRPDELPVLLRERIPLGPEDPTEKDDAQLEHGEGESDDGAEYTPSEADDEEAPVHEAEENEIVDEVQDPEVVAEVANDLDKADDDEARTEDSDDDETDRTPDPAGG
jgi:segregation and condensation protein B